MSMQQTSNQALAVGFSERLQSIEQAMMFQHSYPKALLAMERSASSLPQFPLESGIAPNLFSIEGLCPSVECSSLYDVNYASLTNDTLLDRGSQERIQSTNQNVRRSAKTRGSLAPSPAGMLELSSSFWPETYTCTDAVPKLFNYTTYQENATDFTRVNHYAIFYAKGPRQWMRITASVTFGIESLLWDCERVATSSGSAYEPPGGLDSLLEAFLNSHPNLEQDTYLKVYLGSQRDAREINRALKTQIHIAKPAFQATAYMKMITSMLYHSDCRRISEKELAQIPLRSRRIGRYFISYFRSQWVLDFRFGSSKEQIDSVYYHLQVLRCLQGASRICPFIGVVIDQDTAIVKSFLAEMPAKGPLLGMIVRNTQSGTPISLERRERWCKEITQAVAQVHSKGIVVGNLGDHLRNGVGIDGEDSVVLFRFEKTFRHDDVNCAAVLPPEYRSSRTTEGKISATPHTDIYQLGLLLWRIAYQPKSWRFCKLSGCTTDETTFCIEPHTDPIQLPPLDEKAPQYLKEVIAACRAENPYHRPAARELLELFPQDVGTELIRDSGILDANLDQVSPKTPPKKLIRRLEEVQELYGPGVVTCDLCGRVASKHYFHCSICASANFDICFQCFDDGGQCLEPDHYLREFQDWNQTRVFTNIKENGRREIVAL
jgi:serine/threonine protein kinase